jgi:hypothetical protein
VENKSSADPPFRIFSEPLTRLHVTGLGILLAVVIGFGGWVEFRGALANKRFTDFDTYLRAAWAVRAGGDMYKTTDDRGWHYVYPPLFAILMTPLADPPRGADRKGYLPYEASVGIWYVITLALGAAGIGILAKVVEDPFRNLAAGRGRRYSLRWWALRCAPVLVLLPAIGRCQVRGQLGLVIVFFFCCMAAAILRGRRFRAGLWLSAAVCIEVIPVVLLAFPLWRRDWRMIAGSATGLFAGLILAPLIVLGAHNTIASYNSFYEELKIDVTHGHIPGRPGNESTGITATDSNSPMVVLHNILHPARADRPMAIGPGVRTAHWAIFLTLLAATLLASGWKGAPRRPASSPGHGGGMLCPGPALNRPQPFLLSGKVNATVAEVCFISALIPVMFTATPVFHPHYVSMAVPLVMILIVVLWERYSYGHIPARWKALFWFVALSHVASSIDRGPFLYFRDFGLVLLSTLTLWAAGLAAIRQTSLVPFVSETPLPRPPHADIEKVAVVLPAFNEREIIGQAVESAVEFAALNPDFHFLFVDDGSTDDTMEVLKRCVSQHGAHNVNCAGYAFNRGKGHAIRTGFEMMEADAYCYMDADMAYSTDYLKLMRERLQTADIVIGSRSLHARISKEAQTMRAVLGTSFNWMVTSLLNLPFRDTQAGLKGFRSEAARRLLSRSNVRGFSFDAEILFLARKCGYWIEEFEAYASGEHEYKNGWRVLSMSFTMLRDLLHIKWRNFKGQYD